MEGQVKNALELLRSGALLMVVASILVGISMPGLAISVFLTSIVVPMYGKPAVSLAFGVWGGLVVIALVVAGVALTLYALLGKILPSSSSLASWSPADFSTANSLIRVGYLLGIVLLVVGAPLTLVLIGLPMLVAAYILLLIGHVGLIILCFKLNDKFKSTLILVSGILFIVGIFIPIADFIAWLLLYLGVGEVLLRGSPEGDVKVSGLTNSYPDVKAEMPITYLPPA